MHAFSSFTAQMWQSQPDGKLVSQIDDLSVDAAREIARSATMTGHTGRIICNDSDYCEVFDPKRGFRSGKFAETVFAVGG